MLKAIITIGDDQYLYQVIDINDYIGTLRSLENNSKLRIQFNVYRWRLAGEIRNHTIEFYEAIDTEECGKVYGKYKKACNIWWDYRIQSNQEEDYYLNVINGLNECLNNRLIYNYGCYNTLDESHIGAIKKIQFKIVICYMWLTKNLESSRGVGNRTTEYILYTWMVNNPRLDIVNKLLRLPKEMLINHITESGADDVVPAWKEIFGSISKEINKRELISLLLYLESVKNDGGINRLI